MLVKLVTITSFVFTLMSCDPGYSVVAANRSSGERKIEVVMTDTRRFHALESIFIIESPQGVKVSIDKNVNRLSYSFILEKGKDAIIQQGIGAPDFTENIIVENKDTFFLKNDSRVNIKKEGISTSVTIEIK